LSALALKSDPNKRGADNRQRQALHLRRYVEPRIRLPGFRGADGFGSHHFRISCDLSLMECGLQHAAAFLVSGFVARQQPIAHQFAKQSRAGITNKQVLTGDQNILNPFGLIDEVDALIQNAEKGDWAEAVRGLFKERECSADEPDHFQPARSRRHFHKGIFPRGSDRHSQPGPRP
jgi:hypothetical protein